MFSLNTGFVESFINYLSNTYGWQSGEEWKAICILLGFVLLSIVVSYLLGSINSAIIISKVMYGDDIRRHGSGNAGLTNMLRTYGKSAAALTLVGDMLKTVLAILFTAVIFGFNYTGAISLGTGFCYIAGVFSVFGHVFPIFYGFKGGKGVLTTATMALVLTPIPFAFLLVLFVLIVAMSKYVSLGSISVAILYPVVVNFYITFMFGHSASAILLLCTMILAVFIVWCHRENIKRISDRTERKISIGGKKKKDEDEEA